MKAIDRARNFVAWLARHLTSSIYSTEELRRETLTPMQLDIVKRLVVDIEAAEREAAERMRERCAKVCDDMDDEMERAPQAPYGSVVRSIPLDDPEEGNQEEAQP